MTQPHSRLVAALLLVDLAVLVLVLGHFIQLTDTGFSTGQWNRPLGALAAGLGVPAVVVALPDRRARRALGTVFLGGVGVLVVLQVALDGFRFVWAGGEVALVALEVVLACVGLLLLATGSRRPVVETPPARSEAAAPTRWTVRAFLYILLTIASVLVASQIGSSYGGAQCLGDGDCPSALIASFLFAVGAVVAMAVLVATCELTLRSRRRGLAQ